MMLCPTLVGYTWMLALVTATCLLNRTRITGLVGTLALPCAGSIKVTAGVVKSAPGAVVNVVVTGAVITLPLTFATPVTRTVYTVLPDSAAAGISVSVWFPFPRLRITFTGVLPALNVTCPIVCGFTGSLNWIVTRALIGTCVTALPGLTAVTCGAAVLALNPVVNEML